MDRTFESVVFHSKKEMLSTLVNNGLELNYDRMSEIITKASWSFIAHSLGIYVNGLFNHALNRVVDSQTVPPTEGYEDGANNNLELGNSLVESLNNSSNSVEL